MKTSKTVSSVSTATLSEDDMSEELAPMDHINLTVTGGTPFSKMLSCCIPRDHQQEAEEEEDSNEYPDASGTFPPLEEIDTEVSKEEDEEDVEDRDNEGPTTEVTPTIDSGHMVQLAILGGFLAFQAVSAM